MEANVKFSDLKLSKPIQDALIDAGYVSPTPIQAQAIPALLEGKDLLGCAQTGTGKTAAFTLPILNALSEKKPHYTAKQAKVLVLTPTRELAIQIKESVLSYSKYLKIRTACIYGGVGQVPQVKSMAGGVDILVATPGRLLDLINQRYVDLTKVETFVLDEADQMLDMGFINDVKKILTILPPKRHNLFFSATMPAIISKLADGILHNPVKVAVTPIATTAEKVEQTVMFVEKDSKKNLLLHLLLDKKLKKVIVFARTKHGANKIVDFLSNNAVKAQAIHGNKSQNARQLALENFKLGKTRVLVATDIMARGIDIDEIGHVINFELPNVPESYVHRIGRTGRAGNSGMAISFCDSEERAFLRDIEKLTKNTIPAVDHPFVKKVSPTNSESKAPPVRKEVKKTFGKRRPY